MRGLAATLAATALLVGCAGPTDDTPPGEIADEVTEAMQGMVDAGAAGVAIEVRDGDDVVEAALGSADLAGEVEADPAQQVRIASISKSVLAVVMLQLVEEGELTLDTTVDEVLPGLLDEAPAPVTVEQLLAHTSGIPDHVGALVPTVDDLPAIEQAHQPQALVDVALEQGWLHEPGSEFAYSNTGYTVLGLMAEELTGRSVPDLMAERVLEPVGMSSTTYPEGAEMPDDDAMQSVMTIDGELVDTSEQDPSLWSFGASLVSTVGDVGAFTSALGAGELLEQETLERMREVGESGYGLGVLTGSDACGGLQPDPLFGQRGNGLGSNVISLGSPDGERVVTLAWTGGSFDPADDPIMPAADEALVAALASTCG